MKKLFMVIGTALLLVACSAPAATAANPTRTARSQSTLNGATSLAAVAAVLTETPAPQATSTAPTAPQTAAASVTSTTTQTSLKILSSQGYSLIDGYYIIGEVQNLSDTPMSSVTVTATYEYKFSGKPIITLGTETASILLAVIPANGKAPFKLGPYSFGKPITMYEVKVQGTPGSTAEQSLVVQSSNDYAVGSWLYLRGEIKNTGQNAAQFVKAIITLYDPKGSVVGVVSTYTSPNTIAPGGFSTFATTTNFWPNFDHYSIDIQSQ